VTNSSNFGRGSGAVRIEAASLRDRELPEVPGFPPVSGKPVCQARERGPDSAPNWVEADVRRAIAIAREAGLESYRIEIGPDGTIAVVVGDNSDPQQGWAGWSDVLKP